MSPPTVATAHELIEVAGGVTAAAGFRAAGVAAGLKPSGRLDLAAVVSDEPMTAAAATVTTNTVRAAPCTVTARNLADGRARAVIANSGNANACTGPDGLADAEAMAEALATQLGLAATEVLVLSTGIIGVPLPLERIVAAVPALVADLDAEGGERAARAIMTTDTRVKQYAVEVRDAQGTCVVGGIAKGAGMIEPAMATMLAVVTTDAPLIPAVLRPMVTQVVERTFNRISIDACGSTNDTVVVLANGRGPRPPTLASFGAGLQAVCTHLAHAIVSDGEGVTRVARIEVRRAPDTVSAVALARSVAASALFRAALHGADPNWGRVLAAMGASGVTFEPARVSVAFGGVDVCRFGVAAAFDRGVASAAMAQPEVDVTIDLHDGEASATFLTADLSPQYVAENAYYTT